MRPRATPNRLPARVRALGRNAQLRRLEAASVAWNAGEQLAVVGLVVYAFGVGGASSVAFVGILQSLPLVVLLPVLLRATAGVPIAWLLRSLLAVRLIAMGASGLLIATGGPPLAVYALATMDALAASVARPTRASLVPRLATSPSELVTANVSISTGRSLAGLVGPALAALLLATRDVPATFLLAAGLFGVALALSLAIRPAAPLPRIRPAPEHHGSGLGVLRHESQPRLMVVVLGTQQLVRGMLPVLVVSLAVDGLGAGDQAVGLLNSAIGLGALVGSGLALGVVRHLRIAVVFLLALGLWGLGLIVPGLVPLLGVAALALALGGVGRALLEVTGVTLLQRVVPVGHRASVFGILETIATSCFAVGSLVAAGLVAWLGPSGALVAAGLVPIAVALVTWWPLRSAEEATAANERDVHLLRHVPMLAPLALCTTEELASSVQRTRFGAGEVVIRQGDPGDCFYIVEEGAVEALVDDRPVRVLGSGESFGEIALLRDVPRTATVRTLEPTVLVAMDRDHFLAAVTGRPEAAAAAEEVIRGRLGG
jgi:hypothetical protein